MFKYLNDDPNIIIDNVPSLDKATLIVNSLRKQGYGREEKEDGLIFTSIGVHIQTTILIPSNLAR